MTFHRTTAEVSHGGRRGERVDWVDAVKGLGIILMFYGHFLQTAVAPDNTAAHDQLRLIYSFHMPLFFVLSGFFFRAPDDLGRRVRQLAVRRLIPVAFFGLLLAPLWTAGELRSHLPFWHEAAHVGGEYLRGRPALDWVTWFLVCLFVAEAMALFTLSRLRAPWSRVLFGLACIWLGVVFCRHSIAPSNGLTYVIGRTWFLSEAIVALGFYAIGAALYPLMQALAARRGLAFVVCVLAGAAALTTYRFNHPHAAAVMMAAREHGNVVKFTFTALAGTLSIAALGTLFGELSWLRAIGRNALPLLGLNGAFFHYVDPKLSHFLHVPASRVAVAGDAVIVTALSLLLCAPIVYLLNRQVPQLIGRTHQRGPWLPALEGARALERAPKG